MAMLSVGWLTKQALAVLFLRHGDDIEKFSQRHAGS
jgi:hypothetical protein